MASLSVAGFLLMAAAGGYLLYTRAVFSSAPAVLAAQALALALMIWARASFGRRSFHAAATPTAGGLVTRGPYRYVRHPIYTAACVFFWAGIAAHASLGAVAAGLVMSAGAVMRMLAEERLLRLRYPEYRAYASATKRMLPYLF